MSGNQPDVFDCVKVTDICKVQYSIYGYYPSLPANALFLAVFIACFIGQIVLGIKYRTWSFMLFCACGCFIEIFGYIGRILLHNNPFDTNGFQMQICCLIMGPAFFSAGIYLTLKHWVKAFGEEYSFIRPKWYTWLFISADVLSLTFQAIGGGLASSSQNKPDQLKLGDNLAITGIILQVVILFIFGVLVTVYYTRRHLSDVASRPYVDESLQGMRFKFFCAGICVAFTTIFVRCVYRIAEMIGGWGNPLMQTESYFIGLECAMVAIAGVCLTVLHPGIFFPQMSRPLKKDRSQATDLERKGSASSSESDLEIAKEAKAYTGGVANVVETRRSGSF